MSFQQQNSRDAEKSGLGYGHCTAQKDAKPFSIREYVLMARQGNIEQCWPFAQKYLRLCLKNGITNVLPPMEFPGLPVKAGIVGNYGKTSDAQMDEARKASKPGVDLSAEGSVTFLRRKLGRLSLHDEQPLATKGDAQLSSDQSFKREKGRKRKGRTKMKSLAEIFAVAKHCSLDGHERVYVSTSKVQNADKEKEDCSSVKKHKRCEDSVTGRKMNAYRTGETELKPGGCKRKAGEAYARMP